VAHYQTALDAINIQLDAVIAKYDALLAAGGDPTASLLQATSLDQQRAFIESQMRTFSKAAGATIQASTEAAIQAGISHGLGTLRGSLAPHLQVFRPNAHTIAQVVARTSTGTALDAHLSMMGDQVAQTVVQELITGAINGRGGRETARIIAKTLDNQVPYLKTIVRTETLSGARAGAIQSYRDNPEVTTGWIWYANDAACEICLAMDGMEFRLEDDQDSHVNCGCTSVPILATAASVTGNDSATGSWSPQPYSGDAKFRARPEAEQLKVLGPSKFAAYQDGRLPSISDLVAKTDHPKWGPGLRSKTLKELGLPRVPRAGVVRSEAGRLAAAHRRVEAARAAKVARAAEKARVAAEEAAKIADAKTWADIAALSAAIERDAARNALKAEQAIQREPDWAYAHDEHRTEILDGDSRSPTPNWEHSLTDAEITALEDYTGSGYEEINRALRDGTRYDQTLYDNLTSAIRKGGTFDEPATVWRGVGTGHLGGGTFNSPEDRLSFIEGHYKPGDTFTSAGFESATFDPRVADEFLNYKQFEGYIMEIRAHSGAYISELSSTGNEAEFLMASGTEYRVVGVSEEWFELEPGRSRQHVVVRLEQL
jgi:ADP-ribosyltransferase exoenzyme/Phage Mu protein F like protein